ncbi:hypothetical protein J7I01_004449 [Vibrio parahaemolyticus]|nr:hypothetical protein [Vibrio parahaemolyticus]
MKKILTVTACVALALTGCASHQDAMNASNTHTLQCSSEDNEVALLEHKQSLLNGKKQTEQQNIETLKSSLSKLQRDNNTLEQRRDEVETTDVAEYRTIWQQLKQNQIDTLTTHQYLAESEARLKQLNRESTTLERDLVELKNARTVAHITRLQSELTKETVLEIHNQELCSMALTFNGCVELSQRHSLEKAQDIFQTQLLNAVQYPSNEQLSDIQLNVEVNDSVLLDKHFDGSNELTTVMQVTLQSSPNVDAICKALKVDEHNCQS